LRELGEYLRQMRASRSITLEDAAEATKVSIRYLQALEEGQFNILPAEVYVKGFLRAYGEFLGINPEELYSRYEAERPKERSGFFGRRQAAQKPLRTTPIHAETAFNESSEPKPAVNLASIWASIKAIPGVVYGFVALGIIVGVVMIYSLNGDSNPPETLTSAVLGDTTLQKAASAPKDEEIAQIIILPIDSVNAAQALSVADSLTFEIKAREQVRLYVELDHAKKAFQGLLRRNNKKDWRVKNSIYLEVSNPSALRIVVNGFEIKPFEMRYQQVIEINRQNILQLLAEGYIPPAPGVSSAYGQRIESAQVDTVQGPPSESPSPRTGTREQADSTGSGQSKPKIKPPRTQQPDPKLPDGGFE